MMERKLYRTGLLLTVCALALLFTFGADKRRSELTEADVEKVMQQNVDAWFSGEREHVVNLYLPDGIAADSTIPPFMYQGSTGIREYWRNEMSLFQPNVTTSTEVADVPKATNVTQDNRQIRIFGNVAVAQAHYSSTYILPGGKNANQQGLETVVIKMTERGPKIIAYHEDTFSDRQKSEYAETHK